MFRSTVLVALFALTLLFAPLASAGIIVHATSSYYSSYNDDPDIYDLTDEGAFNGYFFSPFEVGDLAWHAGKLLVAHEDTGTIARLDKRGGLINLISTPINRIDGLAVASTGEIYGAEGSSNRLFKLDGGGSVLDISFLPQSISSLGITTSDDLLFARQQDYYSNFEIVLWDFEDGEQSSFETDLRSVRGITALGGEILVVGSTSTSSSSSAVINRYTMDGAFVGSITGPQYSRSITAHVPEPSTALLVASGLLGLAMRKRRLH